MSSSVPGAQVRPMSKFRRAGDVVIISGTVGARDGRIVEGGIEAQLGQVVANLEQALAGAGATLQDVVRCLCILTDASLLPAFNAAYTTLFADVEPKPTRTTIIAGLPNPDAVVEIEAMASVVPG